MTEDSDTFLRESSRSYKKCQIRNWAEETNLKKHTNEIALERKRATSSLDKEQRQLEEQLRRMNMEKELFALEKIGPGADKLKKKSKRNTNYWREPIEPSYMLDTDNDVFETKIKTENHVTNESKPQDQEDETNVAEEGLRFAQSRGRRQSKEFEDLDVHTATGSLLPPLKNVPNGLLRKALSKNDLHGSGHNLSVIREYEHWAGDPNAINSVRRPRKTVEQQYQDHVFNRSHSDPHNPEVTQSVMRIAELRLRAAGNSTSPITRRRTTSLGARPSSAASSIGRWRKISDSSGDMSRTQRGDSSPLLTRRRQHSRSSSTESDFSPRSQDGSPGSPVRRHQTPHSLHKVSPPQHRKISDVTHFR